MEVHHHPNVGKKHFKEYFLEFMMIFLAVSMGFIAENIREGLSEHAKEREYLINIKKDLIADTASLGIWIPSTEEIKANFDTLISILGNPENTNRGSEMYYLARLSTRSRLFEANDNTLVELKNSGNFRLIRNQEVLDGLVDIEKIKGRYLILSDVETRESELLYPLIGNLFDASVFNKMVTAAEPTSGLSEKDYANSNKNQLQKPPGNPQLRNYDATLINQLMYYLHQIRSSFVGLIKVLTAEKEAEIELIGVISREYDLAGK